MIEKQDHEPFPALLIAPCGMNCALCLAYQRTKNHCAGCNSEGTSKPGYCLTCRVKNCPELLNAEQKYCYTCEKYPCARMRHLDRRYRTKYQMSMLENLAFIRDHGLEPFLDSQQERWTCPHCGALRCVHRPQRPHCSQAAQKEL